MSDKPYVKECSFCKNKITMSKESGNWLPYELNSDKKHDCRTEIVNVTNNKKQEHSPRQITLEMVQKKLESIGIIINIDRLMKEE